MRRHAAQHGSIAVIADVTVNRRYPWRHAERLGNVEGLLCIVTALRREAVDGASIGGNAYALCGPLLLGVLVVGVDIGNVEPEKLQQSDVLALAGESGALVISGPHVATAERSSRTGPGCRGRLHARGAARHQGTRNRIVIQAGDVPELEGQVDGGFAIRRIKVAVRIGIVIDAHIDMERRLDGRYRPLE